MSTHENVTSRASDGSDFFPSNLLREVMTDNKSLLPRVFLGQRLFQGRGLLSREPSAELVPTPGSDAGLRATA